MSNLQSVSEVVGWSLVAISHTINPNRKQTPQVKFRKKIIIKAMKKLGMEPSDFIREPLKNIIASSDAITFHLNGAILKGKVILAEVSEKKGLKWFEMAVPAKQMEGTEVAVPLGGKLILDAYSRFFERKVNHSRPYRFQYRISKDKTKRISVRIGVNPLTKIVVDEIRRIGVSWHFICRLV